MTITGSSVLQRDPGATVVVAPYGPRGPVIAGTSVTPVLIANGPVTFEMTEYGLGFAPGTRVRATATAGSNQWMEGVVTGYSDAELDVMVDLHSGSDIYYAWQITVAGEPGIAGPQGPKGDTGDIPEAPGDHIKYARLDGQWANITVDLADKAPIDAPIFTGDPRAPTPATADNSVSLATTAYVKANITSLIPTLQPIDADLTAIAALAGTNVIYYRSAANVWSPVIIGSGIAFTGGTISAAAGGGNVSNSGTPVANQLAMWVNNQQIKGVDGITLFAPVNSPVFTGDPRAPTPATADNDTSIATTAFVQAVMALMYSTGDVKPTYKTVADPGWLMMDDGTIGDDLSGATSRANADTLALYTLMWGLPAGLGILDSAGNSIARAGSALADFNSHHRLILPKALGRSIALAGAGVGLTARVLGSATGTETTSPTIDTMPSHNHAGTYYGDASAGGSYGAVWGGPNSPVQFGVPYQGGGQPFNIIDPIFHVNVMVKL